MGRSKKKTRTRRRASTQPERRVVKRREVILEYDDGTIERKVHVEGPTGRRLVERSLRAGDYDQAPPPKRRADDQSAHDLRDRDQDPEDDILDDT